LLRQVLCWLQRLRVAGLPLSIYRIQDYSVIEPGKISMKRIVILTVVFSVFGCLQSSAMPVGMSAQCQATYARYEAAIGAKAFAKGQTTKCGWAFANGPTRNINDVRSKAIGFCNAGGDDKCKVVAEESQ
jgi:hypothetical protein